MDTDLPLENRCHHALDVDRLLGCGGMCNAWVEACRRDGGHATGSA
jgi:hypothetical protein